MIQLCLRFPLCVPVWSNESGEQRLLDLVRLDLSLEAVCVLHMSHCRFKRNSDIVGHASYFLQSAHDFKCTVTTMELKKLKLTHHGNI